MLHALHPELIPVVLSLSSLELQQRLENLSIDMGLGYSERLNLRELQLTAQWQYTEQYFLLRKAARAHSVELQVGQSMQWKQAADLPLCLLTPDMHNRTIVDAAFAAAGCTVNAAIETNSILTMALSVVAGQVCSVMPGALVSAVRGYRELEALPLVDPQVMTPISFMVHATARPSRTMKVALALAHDRAWLQHAASHTGLMVPI
jgi:DNA-binding transcriptional LysR family regulator